MPRLAGPYLTAEVIAPIPSDPIFLALVFPLLSTACVALLVPIIYHALSNAAALLVGVSSLDKIHTPLSAQAKPRLRFTC